MPIQIPFLILAAILLFFAFQVDVPTLHQLNKRAKKYQKNAKNITIRKVERLKKDIERAFESGRIDGMEREFLYRRLKIIEDTISAQFQPTGPKYAAGSEMDRLGPPR